jgi:hypothetical protein
LKARRPGLIFLAFLILFRPGAAAAQDWVKAWAGFEDFHPFELTFFGGPASGPIRGGAGSKTGTEGFSRYSDQWSYWRLKSVRETADISVRSKPAMFVGAAVEYLWRRDVGLQLQAGYLSSELATTSTVELAWAWEDGRSDRRTSSWEGSGSLGIVPLSLDVVVRLGGPRLVGLLSAGPTIFFNSFSAGSDIVFGFTKSDEAQTTQYVDALRVAVRTGTVRWVSLGANAGAGISFKIRPGVGLCLEAKYFLNSRPSRSIAWAPVPGRSDGLYFSDSYSILKGVEFTADDARGVVDGLRISRMSVKPSFFQVSAGIRLYFGL